MSRPRHLLAALAIAALSATAAASLRAHDIYSSWTEAVIGQQSLDLTFTLARASAARLINQKPPIVPITPENFAEQEPQLKAVASELFRVTSGGKSLPLGRCEIKVSGDADIVFSLHYSAPAAGKLRFEMNYLFRLVDGHVGTLVVTGRDGKDLGWSPVTVDQPAFEVAVPEAPP